MRLRDRALTSNFSRYFFSDPIVVGIAPKGKISNPRGNLKRLWPSSLSAAFRAELSLPAACTLFRTLSEDSSSSTCSSTYHCKKLFVACIRLALGHISPGHE